MAWQIRECAGKWDIHGNLLSSHCSFVVIYFLSRYATQSCWHFTKINYVWLQRFLASEISVELNKFLSIDLFRWAQNSNQPSEIFDWLLFELFLVIELLDFSRRDSHDRIWNSSDNYLQKRERSDLEKFMTEPAIMSLSLHIDLTMFGSGKTEQKLLTLSRDNYKIWFSEKYLSSRQFQKRQRQTWELS